MKNIEKYCKYIENISENIKELDDVIFNCSNDITLQNVLNMYNKLKAIEIKTLGIISDIREMKGMSYIILPNVLDHNYSNIHLLNMTLGTVITTLAENSCDKSIDRFFTDYLKYLENESTMELLNVLYSRYIFILKKHAILHKLAFCMLNDTYNSLGKSLHTELERLFKSLENSDKLENRMFN